MLGTSQVHGVLTALAQLLCCREGGDCPSSWEPGHRESHLLNSRGYYPVPGYHLAAPPHSPPLTVLCPPSSVLIMTENASPTSHSQGLPTPCGFQDWAWPGLFSSPLFPSLLFPLHITTQGHLWEGLSKSHMFSLCKLELKHHIHLAPPGLM